MGQKKVSLLIVAMTLSYTILFKLFRQNWQLLLSK